jgi:hypothetical protein
MFSKRKKILKVSEKDLADAAAANLALPTSGGHAVHFKRNGIVSIRNCERVPFSCWTKREITAAACTTQENFNMLRRTRFTMKEIRIIYTSIGEVTPRKFNAIYKFMDAAKIEIQNHAQRPLFEAQLTQLFRNTKVYYKKAQRRKVQRYEAIFNMPVPFVFAECEAFSLRIAWPENENAGDRLFFDLAGTQERAV